MRGLVRTDADPGGEHWTRLGGVRRCSDGRRPCLLLLFRGRVADRLAEAFAERLHQRVRTDFWGYAADEALGVVDLVGERYRGIRPAPGYPACPDHTVKRDVFRALGCDEIGMTLTESLAMLPAASVSGFYFANPEARYFNVGRIGPDQLKSWAERNASSVDAAERALAPLL